MSEIESVSADLLESIRQTAPASTPYGRDQWVTILSWVAAGLSALSAIAAAVLYFM